MLLIINDLKNDKLKNDLKNSIKYVFLSKLFRIETKKNFVKNIKIKKTNVYINYNIYTNEGIIYKKYKKSLEKHKLINLDLILNKYIKDDYLYKLFFLKRTNKFKLKMMKLKIKTDRLKK